MYCRPLMEREPGMKIWCAAGVVRCVVRCGDCCGDRIRDGVRVWVSRAERCRIRLILLALLVRRKLIIRKT